MNKEIIVSNFVLLLCTGFIVPYTIIYSKKLNNNTDKKTYYLILFLNKLTGTGWFLNVNLFHKRNDLLFILCILLGMLPVFSGSILIYSYNKIFYNNLNNRNWSEIELTSDTENIIVI